MSASRRFTSFWSGAGGGREVMAVAYPLILSHMVFTVQVFLDRLFLTWYGPRRSPAP
jgi:MATE family multidrug resistance protein